MTEKSLIIKTCRKCGIIKSISDFNKNKRNKDGLRNWCRECQSVSRTEYYATHKEQEKERNLHPILKPVGPITHKMCSKCKIDKSISEFYERSDAPGTYTSQCKKCQKSRFKNYTDSHKKVIAEYHRNQRLKNPELFAEISRIYYWSNLEKEKKRSKKYRTDNADEIKIRAIKYYNENIDKIAKWTRKYLESPKGKASTARANHKHRALMKKTKCTLTADQWERILKMQNDRCNGCGRKFDENLKPERDHIIPLSLGGDFTFGNVQALCKSCNCRKHAKINFARVLTEIFFDEIEKK